MLRIDKVEKVGRIGCFRKMLRRILSQHTRVIRQTLHVGRNAVPIDRGEEFLELLFGRSFALH